MLLLRLPLLYLGRFLRLALNLSLSPMFLLLLFLLLLFLLLLLLLLRRLAP